MNTLLQPRDIDEIREVAKLFGHQQGAKSSQIFMLEPPMNPIFEQYLKQVETCFRMAFGADVEVIPNGATISGFDTRIFYRSGNEGIGFIVSNAENATFVIGDKGTISFRNWNGSDIELSRMLINTEHRKKGIGTIITTIAKETAFLFGKRILLLPCPPLAESKGMSDYEIGYCQDRLRRWYSTLGFVNALPEFVETTCLQGNRKKYIGIPRLMVAAGKPLDKAEMAFAE